MEQLIAPVEVSAVRSFGGGLFDYFGTDEENDHQRGQISQDGQWSWLIKKSRLVVVSSRTGELISAWTFNGPSKDMPIEITCVQQFTNVTQGQQLLLVGMDCFQDGGLISLFNVSSSKVIRTIQLPHRVTVLSTINGLLAGELNALGGNVAVGTVGGHVLLLDLCLDFAETGIHPLQIACYRPHEKGLILKRKQAWEKQAVVCILLNASAFTVESTFLLVNENGDSVSRHFTRKVAVSALYFLPQMGMLAVGFSFGAFQLWNLEHMIIEHVCSLENRQVPVSHFAFQEPENDPLPCCYLWVLHSCSSVSAGSSSFFALYVAHFQTRELVVGLGNFYTGLKSVVSKFEMELTGNPYSNTPDWNGSRILSCGHIPYKTKYATEASDVEEDWDLTLFSIIWESYTSQLSLHVAIFDLNMWYKQHLPPTCDIRRRDLSPFIAFYLFDVFPNLTENVLHARLKPQSFSKFIGPEFQEEQHFYPSALSFGVSCLTEDGHFDLSFLGVQQKVLHLMQRLGPQIMINPYTTFSQCAIVGLLPPGADIHTCNSVVQQREALFKVALANNQTGLLVRCMNEWADGRHASRGCLPSTLVDWAWNNVEITKNCIDQLSKPLFDCSDFSLSEESIKQLSHTANKLNQLLVLLQVYAGRMGETTPPHVRDEANTQVQVVELLNTYLKVLIWFHQTGLLPEYPEGHSIAADIPYLAKGLGCVFDRRRHTLSDLGLNFNILYIDNLVHEVGEPLRQAWLEGGGTGEYPPPSLHALISVYLLPDVPLVLKHQLVLYTFLDLAALLPADRFSGRLEHLLKFPLAFGISHSLVKLTQAFWLLDHTGFDDAVNYFLDPLIPSKDVAPSQHRIVVRALLHQDEAKKALTYVRLQQPPVEDLEDVKLYASPMIKQNLLTEALRYFRSHCSPHDSIMLLRHFYQECDAMNILDDVLRLPLQQCEEIELVHFLENGGTKKPHLREKLLLYYLQRSRFVEAIQLGDQLKGMVLGSDAKSRERALIRDAIMGGYAHCLPSISKQVALESAARKGLKRDASCQMPISAHVQQNMNNGPVLANPISTAVDHTRELWKNTTTSNAVRTRRRKCRSLSRPTSPAPEMSFLFAPAKCVGYRNNESNKPETPKTFPKEVGTLEEEEPEECAIPAKRMRTLLDNISGERHYTPRIREALSLLRTPPVSRYSPNVRLAQVPGVLPRELPSSLPSILKPSKTANRTPSPESRSRSPSEVSLEPSVAELDDNIEDMEVETVGEITSKQLRFALPIEKQEQDSQQDRTFASTPESSPSEVSLDTARPNIEERVQSSLTILKSLSNIPDPATADEAELMNVTENSELYYSFVSDSKETSPIKLSEETAVMDENSKTQAEHNEGQFSISAEEAAEPEVMPMISDEHIANDGDAEDMSEEAVTGESSNQIQTENAAVRASNSANAAVKPVIGPSNENVDDDSTITAFEVVANAAELATTVGTIRKSEFDSCTDVHTSIRESGYEFYSEEEKSVREARRQHSSVLEIQNTAVSVTVGEILPVIEESPEEQTEEPTKIKTCSVPAEDTSSQLASESKETALVEEKAGTPCKLDVKADSPGVTDEQFGEKSSDKAMLHVLEESIGEQGSEETLVCSSQELSQEDSENQNHHETRSVSSTSLDSNPFSRRLTRRQKQMLIDRGIQAPSDFGSPVLPTTRSSKNLKVSPTRSEDALSTISTRSTSSSRPPLSRARTVSPHRTSSMTSNQSRKSQSKEQLHRRSSSRRSATSESEMPSTPDRKQRSTPTTPTNIERRRSSRQLQLKAIKETEVLSSTTQESQECDSDVESVVSERSIVSNASSTVSTRVLRSATKSAQNTTTRLARKFMFCNPSPADADDPQASFEVPAAEGDKPPSSQKYVFSPPVTRRRRRSSLLPVDDMQLDSPSSSVFSSAIPRASSRLRGWTPCSTSDDSSNSPSPSHTTRSAHATAQMSSTPTAMTDKETIPSKKYKSVKIRAKSTSK